MKAGPLRNPLKGLTPLIQSFTDSGAENPPVYTLITLESGCMKFASYGGDFLVSCAGQNVNSDLPVFYFESIMCHCQP